MIGERCSQGRKKETDVKGKELRLEKEESEEERKGVYK